MPFKTAFVFRTDSQNVPLGQRFQEISYALCLIASLHTKILICRQKAMTDISDKECGSPSCQSRTLRHLISVVVRDGE